MQRTLKKQKKSLKRLLRHTKQRVVQSYTSNDADTLSLAVTTAESLVSEPCSAKPGRTNTAAVLTQKRQVKVPKKISRTETKAATTTSIQSPPKKVIRSPKRVQQPKQRVVAKRSTMGSAATTPTPDPNNESLFPVSLNDDGATSTKDGSLSPVKSNIHEMNSTESPTESETTEDAYIAGTVWESIPATGAAEAILSPNVDDEQVTEKDTNMKELAEIPVLNGAPDGPTTDQSPSKLCVAERAPKPHNAMRDSSTEAVSDHGIDSVQRNPDTEEKEESRELEKTIVEDDAKLPSDSERKPSLECNKKETEETEDISTESEILAAPISGKVSVEHSIADSSAKQTDPSDDVESKPESSKRVCEENPTANTKCSNSNEGEKSDDEDKGPVGEEPLKTGEKATEITSDLAPKDAAGKTATNEVSDLIPSTVMKPQSAPPKSSDKDNCKEQENDPKNPTSCESGTPGIAPKGSASSESKKRAAVTQRRSMSETPRAFSPFSAVKGTSGASSASKPKERPKLSAKSQSAPQVAKSSEGANLIAVSMKKLSAPSQEVAPKSAPSLCKTSMSSSTESTPKMASPTSTGSSQTPSASNTSRAQQAKPPLPPVKQGDVKQSEVKPTDAKQTETKQIDDETSTVASTLTGGPVSYVEFKSVVDEQPDDTQLTQLARLLTVQLWSPDATVVKTALDQLNTMCEVDRIKEIQGHGGHMCLVLILRKWPTSAPIQAAALNCLHKTAESLEFCQSVAQLGVLDLVLVAMKNHPRNEAVATAGCGALLNLTLPAENARELVFKLRGIPTICTACATFSQTIMLQKYVLWLIQYMSYWEDFRPPLVQDGGLHALAEMIERFSDGSQDAIVKSARATMHRLL